MPSRSAGVFLNFPFDDTYESYLLALVSAIVCAGRTPRTVLEVAEQGTGRINRMMGLLQDCSLSIHDLSCVGLPVRFNMPFELGLAAAISHRERNGGRAHSFIIIEREPNRIDRTLSDLKHLDPLIYGQSVRTLMASIFDALAPDRNRGNVGGVYRVYRDLRAATPMIKRRHASPTVFTRRVFRDLVGAAAILAESKGVL